MRVYFSIAASEELEAAFEYFQQQQSGLGFRFTADVDEALARIHSQPLAWHPLGKHFRRCHLQHFRYGLIYRIRGEQREVLTDAQESRRPGYWRSCKH